MGSPPEYPVLNDDPSFKLTVDNFNQEDWVITAVGSIAPHLFIDKGPHPAAKVACSVASFLSAFAYSYYKSYNRLRGNIDNSVDIPKYMKKN